MERFVASAVEPAVLDSGEEPLRLIPDHWSLSEWNGRLMLQAWDSRRNLVRKVTGLGVQKRDRIGLLVNARGGSTAEAEEAAEYVSNGPPIEQLRDHLAIAHDHLIAGMSSQPFFVFFILCVMYGGTCVLLFSMLWLMDGFRQDRAVSMTGRRH